MDRWYARVRTDACGRCNTLRRGFSSFRSGRVGGCREGLGGFGSFGIGRAGGSLVNMVLGEGERLSGSTVYMILAEVAGRGSSFDWFSGRFSRALEVLHVSGDEGVLGKRFGKCVGHVSGEGAGERVGLLHYY